MKNTLEQKMREYVKAWEGSGQRQVDFCKAHGLKKDQFYYWKAKFQREELTEGKIGFQEIFLRPGYTDMRKSITSFRKIFLVAKGN